MDVTHTGSSMKWRTALLVQCIDILLFVQYELNFFSITVEDGLDQRRLVCNVEDSHLPAQPGRSSFIGIGPGGIRRCTYKLPDSDCAHIGCCCCWCCWRR